MVASGVNPWRSGGRGHVLPKNCHPSSRCTAVQFGVLEKAGIFSFWLSNPAGLEAWEDSRVGIHWVRRATFLPPPPGRQDARPTIFRVGIHWFCRATFLPPPPGRQVACPIFVPARSADGAKANTQPLLSNCVTGFPSFRSCGRAR